jgi:hypothetical protein
METGNRRIVGYVMWQCPADHVHTSTIVRTEHDGLDAFALSVITLAVDLRVQAGVMY